MTAYTKYTDDQLHVAVAEALKWNHVHYARDLSESTGKDCFRGQPPGVRTYYDNVPNYPSSLDACAEFEDTLTGAKKHSTYCKNLTEALGPYGAITAKPRQRSLAFLATVAEKSTI